MTTGGALRLMPMGDSITAGDDVPGGYRAPLFDLLTGQGYVVDLLGPYRQGGDPTPDGNHWGRPGLGIADTGERLDGRSYVSLQANEGPQGAVREGLYDDLGAAISRRYFSGNPDDTNLLLLLVGTNDVVHQVVEAREGARPAGDLGNDGRGEQQDRIAEAAFERLESFLAQVNRQAQAEALRLDVVLGTIPDISNDWNRGGLRDPISEVMRDELRQYNRWILERLDGRLYSHITLTAVDTFAAVGGDLEDGLHPSAEGQRRMALTWAEGIGEVLARFPQDPGVFVRGNTYALPLRDFDGNPHGLADYGGDVAIAWDYRYQGEVDANGDGSLELIFTNRTSGRWATAGVDPLTGRIDPTDHGAGGATRVVGIYIDPLVAEGEANGGFLRNGEAAPARFGPFDSQQRFQNDLRAGNLLLRTAADFDGDGFQEIYWKLNDGTAYLRTIMHADGNIQYGNYQSETQMRDFLSAMGQTDVLSQIL